MKKPRKKKSSARYQPLQHRRPRSPTLQRTILASLEAARVARHEKRFSFAALEERARQRVRHALVRLMNIAHYRFVGIKNDDHRKLCRAATTKAIETATQLLSPEAPRIGQTRNLNRRALMRDGLKRRAS